MVELLLSLSAISMMCLFLLPLYMEIRSQTEQTRIDKKAEQLMFEELQAQLMGALSYSSYSVFDSGIEYLVTWRDRSPTLKEVCVKVEHSTLSSAEICGVQE